MVKRYSSVELKSNNNIPVWHIVGEVGTNKQVILVSITNNPLIVAPGRYANIVYYKTAALSTAKQVARGARRHFSITSTVPVRKHGQPSVDVPYGAICMNGRWHEAEQHMPGYDFLIFASSHTVDEIMKHNPHNVPDASKLRYVVYEVRGSFVTMRGITNKMHSVERWWREAPPEGYLNSVLIEIGRFQSYEEAVEECKGHFKVSDELWPKRPSTQYLRRILKIDEHGDILWVASGESAIRTYDSGKVVCIGPHTYTYAMMKTAIEIGIWVDRRRNEDIFPF